MNKTTWLAALTLLSSPTFAETVSVEMIDLGSGQSTGTVMISDSDYGTVLHRNYRVYPLVRMASIYTLTARVTALPKKVKPFLAVLLEGIMTQKKQASMASLGRTTIILAIYLRFT